MSSESAHGRSRRRVERSDTRSGERLEIVKFTRVYGDDSGETRLHAVEFPGGFRNVIPAKALRIGLTMPQHPGFHPASVRGFVVALRGEFEVVATSGDRKRFRQGEWLFADDVGSKGHTFEAFGSDQELLHCAVPEDWDGWTASLAGRRPATDEAAGR